MMLRNPKLAPDFSQMQPRVCPHHIQETGARGPYVVAGQGTGSHSGCARCGLHKPVVPVTLCFLLYPSVHMCFFFSRLQSRPVAESWKQRTLEDRPKKEQ